MSSWTIQKMCLSCRHYRLKDEMSGICRVEKGNPETYPMKINGDVCNKWKDCGQQYYIRKGWIKGRENSENKVEKN